MSQNITKVANEDGRPCMHHITQHHTNLHIALSVTWNTNKYSPKLYIKIQYISVARKRVETRLHSVWRIFGRKEGLLRLDGKGGGGVQVAKQQNVKNLAQSKAVWL